MIDSLGNAAARDNSAARCTRVAILSLIVIGCALRIANFAGGRSLWLDEAFITLNIAHLPPRELLGQLRFGQIAPVGWLMLEKWLLGIWGDFDYSLRFVSVICGVGALLVFWALVRRALDSTTALLALGLFVVAPPLVEYSSMVKPYIVDAFFSVVMTLLAVRLIQDGPSGGWTLALGGAGLCAITLSFPAILVMAPIGLILLTHAVINGNRRSIVILALVGTSWLALFAFLHFGFHARQTTTIDNMQNLHWSSTFAPLPPRTLGELAWYPRSGNRTIGWLLNFPSVLVLGLLLLAGGSYLARSRPWLFALCTGPIVTAVLVSAMRAYPFESRFTLFLAPQFLILLAAGITATARVCRPFWAAVGLLGLALSANAIAETSRSALSSPPWPIEEIKPDLAYIAAHAAPDDTIFLSYAAERAYLLYESRYGLTGRSYLVGSMYRVHQNCVYADVETLRRQKGPSWIVLSHFGVGDMEPTRFFLHILREVGDLTLIHNRLNNMLYRFEPWPSATVLPKPDQACFADRQEREFLEAIAASNRNGTPVQSQVP